MIRRISLALVAVIVMVTAAQAQLKVMTEFRGMNFGADLSEIQHMVPEDSRGAIRFFKKYADDKTFQGIALKELHYGFVENKFALVLFNAQGPSAFNTLKAYFDTTYGQPHQPSKGVKQYTYGAGDVSIEMGYDDTRKVCEVSYIYRPLMSKLGGPKKQ